MKFTFINIILVFILAFLIVIAYRQYQHSRPMQIEVVEIVKDGVKPYEYDPAQFWSIDNRNVSLSADKHSILITGMIEDDTVVQFSKLLNNDIKTVVISSPGGGVVSSIQIATEIYKRKLDTLIPSNGGCFSGCTIVFQAGERRAAYANSMFAYHSAKAEFPNGQLAISDYGTAQYWAYILIFGINPDIFNTITDMKTDYFISAENSMKYNIVNILIPVDTGPNSVYKTT